MTQPIQEPTPPRAISRLTWGENQLYRRPAPLSSAGGFTSDWFYAIWAQSSVTLASGTWSEITDADPFGQEYFEYYISDPNDCSFSFNPATGILTWNPDYLIVMTGQTLFSSSFASGDTVGVGINIGVSGSFTGDRQINITPVKNYLTDGGEWNTVHTHNHPSFSSADSARVEGYQVSSGNKTWQDVRFTAHSVRLREPGTFFNP